MHVTLRKFGANLMIELLVYSHLLYRITIFLPSLHFTLCFVCRLAHIKALLVLMYFMLVFPILQGLAEKWPLLKHGTFMNMPLKVNISL